MGKTGMPDDDDLDRIVNELLVSTKKINIGSDEFNFYEEISDKDFKIGAVDGSSTIIVNGASFLVCMVRAGYHIYGVHCGREGMHRSNNSSAGTSKGGSAAPPGLCEKFVLGPVLGLISVENIHEFYEEPGPGGGSSTKSAEVKGEISEASAEQQMLLAVQRQRVAMEWRMISDLVGRLDEGDVVLVDGNFTPVAKRLEPVIEDSIERADRRGVHLVGISKRSTLAVGHVPLVPYLTYVAKKSFGKKLWYYRATSIAKSMHSDVYVVHYHPLAPMSFRTDIATTESKAAGVKNDCGSIFGKICRYCKNPGYLGYPYPLAAIHNEVVIDSDTRELWRRKIALRVSEKLGAEMFENLEFDFHNILDLGR